MKIAIIGSGIAGLTCAHTLHPQHAIQVFEANEYIGGHTATIDLELQGKTWAIDTGFIVFNDRTYPRFQGLLDKLGVPYQATEMSFSVSNAQTGLIYNGHSLATLFAQKRNLLSPKFYGLLADILRFNKQCKALYDTDIPAELTLGDYLQQQQFSTYFAENYILPMAAAIWSASLGEVEHFPLKFFIQFFHNHGLLNVSDRPQWYTIQGGSKQYIPYFTRGLEDRLHVNQAVQSVERSEQGVELLFKNGERQHFDKVIFACHSDQALSLLAPASALEQSVLGAIPYRDNEVVLHHDAKLLPPIPAAVASWNYHLDSNKAKPASVTYSMNILQNLPADAPSFCVTLNNTAAIDPDKILRKFCYSHPVFSQSMVAAQQRRSELQGQQHSYFCGAYWYNGFHEDGVRSALEVCQHLGVQP